MKKLHIKILIILMTVGIVSCKKTLSGLLNSPNHPTPVSADVDLYVNEVELNFNDFFQYVSDYSGQLSRQQNWIGPLYQNAYTPPSFDQLWTTAYSNVINNANAAVPLAEAKKAYIQAGIVQVLKAYTLGTLVDMFNDVPDKESELGLSNINPKADAGATVYAHVQSLLDSAITEFGKTGATAITSDLFYGSSGNQEAPNWITFAKTLKLKFYMQTRLVDNTAAANIKALITENNLINSPAQDFQFQYGINNSSPDARHPHYALDYVASGGEGEYLSNYFMWAVAAQKYGGTDRILDTTKINGSRGGDPRLRYYFYRQVDGLGDFSATLPPCYVNVINGTYPAWYPSVPDQTPYCVVGSKGYYGRDHGDNSGAPPDDSYRTAWGIYPAGGQFDANQADSAGTSDNTAVTTLVEGGKGAGISPIWQSSFTYFLEAEAALTVNTGGDASALLTKGVNASITKVLGFPSTVGVTVPVVFEPTDNQIAAYSSLVSKNFTTASSAQAKLNVLMTEYYIALWGNGIEAYNNLRRTGMPLNLQPAVSTANPGLFMRSFFYPSVYVNRNLNHAPQKNPGLSADKVFWDNNPDNFIK